MTERKNLLLTVVEAIDEATCGGRDGPFGLYDYSRPGENGGTIPRHVIRDFRALRDGQYGRHLHEFTDAGIARAMFDQMTKEHVAAAAIRAVYGHMAGDLDDAMAVHYPLPDSL